MPNKRWYNMLLLFTLYVSQGLPFGFQATALPIYLRTQGVSLTAIGFLGALSLPWMLKAFWAPLIDRYYSRNFGRRRSWIVPTQILIVVTVFLSSWISPQNNLWLLLVSVFVMNLFAATQDIAVDGLAVDILKAKDLGMGNTAQVVGYKFGMLFGGGILVWLSDKLGWPWLFWLMAIIAVVPLLLITFYRENEEKNDSMFVEKTITLVEIFEKVKQSVFLPGSIYVLLLIGTYKMGEAMIDTMFKPFLIDSGFTAGQIGLWVGTYGMVASLLGSVLGGVLATKWRIYSALGLALLLRIFPLLMQCGLVFVTPASELVVAATLAEHFFGGILTTTMFAFMMSKVNKKIGATHYTILASIEVIGKAPASFASGIIAQSSGGYPLLFVVGLALTVGVFWFWYKVGTSYKSA